jgi:6,7-dimethyl-8-ribityllumazine synthase
VKGVSLAIVVSRLNFDITYMMSQRVLPNTEPLRAEVKVMVEVP